MEEKGRNFVWRLCFHMGLQAPSYPTWGVWAVTEGVTVLFSTSSQALYCPKKGVHPTACSEEEGASSPPRLCSTQQASQGLLGELKGTMAQARDMDSCRMARPGCKKVSHLCAKRHYGCIPTILFQMSPSAVLSVLNFRSGFTPLYVLTTPRPSCVTALVLLRKGSTSLSQAFEWPIRVKVYLHFGFNSEKMVNASFTKSI